MANAVTPRRNYCVYKHYLKSEHELSIADNSSWQKGV